MKISISNIAWSPHNRIDIYNFLKKNNVKNIEIAPKLFLFDEKKLFFPKKKNLDNKLKELKKYNLKIISMQSLLYNSQNCELFTSVKKRENLFNHLKKIIKLAGKLKIPNLVFGSPKNRIIPSKLNTDKANLIAIKLFRKLGNYAYKNKTTISIESNPKIYGTNFLNNIYETYNFVQKVNHKSVKMILDTGEILINQNLKEISYIINLTKKFIHHVHISQPFLKPLNNTKMVNLVFKELQKINYNKYISIEMKNPGDNNIKIVKNSILRLIKIRKNYLKKL